jgi:hypothetical protein
MTAFPRAIPYRSHVGQGINSYTAPVKTGSQAQVDKGITPSFPLTSRSRSEPHSTDSHSAMTVTVQNRKVPTCNSCAHHARTPRASLVDPGGVSGQFPVDQCKSWRINDNPRSISIQCSVLYIILLANRNEKIKAYKTLPGFEI